MSKNKKVVFKATVLTDTHHTGVNPKSRKDNFFETTLLKVKEVAEISDKENVDIVIHCGDLTNTPYLTNNITGRIGETYKLFKQPVYIVAGNHDLGEGNDIKNLPNTTLGVLIKHNILHSLKYKEKIMFEKDGLSIQLTGAPSCFGIDKNKDYYIVEEKEADVAIHVVHGMLLKESSNPHMSYVPINSIMEQTKADVTLSGHWHLGFDPVEYNGKLFINPGALVRKYNFLEEINRKPRICILSIYDDKSIEYKFVELETAFNGQDVLDKEKMLEEQEYDKKLEEFKTSFEMKDDELVFAPIEETLKVIGEKNNLDEEIVKECLVRIDAAKKELDLFNPQTDKGVFIKKITMHNFQSYTHKEIELVDGVNVFIGESDRGKTTLTIRALQFALFNDLRGNDFVRDTGKLTKKGDREKEKLCYVSVEFSNGVEVTRKIEGKKSTYELVDENGELQLFENFGSSVPKAIVDATGIQKFKVDKDVEFNLNIREAREVSLIQQTGNLKAKFLGTFAGTNSSDMSIRSIQSDMKNNSMKIKIIDNDIDVIKKDIEKMGDIEKKRKLVEELNNTFNELKQLNDKYNFLLNKNNKIKETLQEMSLCQEVVAQKQKLEYLEFRLLKAEVELNEILKLQDRYNYLVKMKNNIIEKQNEIKICSEVVNCKPIVDKNLEKINSIEDKLNEHIKHIESLNNKSELLIKYRNKIEESKINIEKSKKYLEKKSIIEKKSNKLQEMENFFLEYFTFEAQAKNKLDYLNSKKQSIESKKNSIKKGKDWIEDLDRKRSILVETTIKDIISLGKCPTCYSDIDSHSVEDIRKELLG